MHTRSKSFFTKEPNVLAVKKDDVVYWQNSTAYYSWTKMARETHEIYLGALDQN